MINLVTFGFTSREEAKPIANKVQKESNAASYQLYNKRYYYSHKQQIKEHHQSNREYFREYYRRYYQENKQQLDTYARMYRKQFYQRHRERLIARVKAWKERMKNNEEYQKKFQERKKEYEKRYRAKHQVPTEKYREYRREYMRKYYHRMKENEEFMKMRRESYARCRESKIEYNKQYRAQNRAQTVICECGCTLHKNSLKRHRETKKHKKLTQNQK